MIQGLEKLGTQMRRDDISDAHAAGCGFSVASYNIHKYVGIDGKFDPERVTRVIKELKAEIVGLQ